MGRRKWQLEQDKNDMVVRRQRGALYVITIAICLDVIFGLAFARFEHISAWHGLYWSESEATTVGSDIIPRTNTGEILKALVGVTVIPLFAATFSIFTTALTAVHVHHSEHQLKAHVEETIKHHLGKETNDGEANRPRR